MEFALFDMRLHWRLRAGDAPAPRCAGICDEVRRGQPSVPPAFNRFQHSFSHIFAGGYAAGYYSYKWAEVLSRRRLRGVRGKACPAGTPRPVAGKDAHRHHAGPLVDLGLHAPAGR
jgi:hypothetical protein